jgi:hypothetical protein
LKIVFNWGGSGEPQTVPLQIERDEHMLPQRMEAA